MRFQPIFHHKEIFAYEALYDSPFNYELFSKASPAFELECFFSALKHADRAKMPFVFINASAGMIQLYTNELLQLKKCFDIKTAVEITERESSNFFRLQQCVRKLKKAGYLISLDDFGRGSSIAYLDLQPDYVKIDSSIVRSCHASQEKISLLKTFASWETVIPIAEGVETEKEYQACIEAGIEYFQGYYLAYPQKPENLKGVVILAVD